MNGTGDATPGGTGAPDGAEPHRPPTPPAKPWKPTLVLLATAIAGIVIILTAAFWPAILDLLHPATSGPGVTVGMGATIG